MSPTLGDNRMFRIGLTLLVVVLAIGIWVPFAGSFLDDREGPVAADAIVVLAGNAPDRLPYAEALMAQGLGQVLVVSNERVHTHGLETTWLALHQAGVSAPEIRDADLLVVDDPPPESTIDEARRDADLLAAHHLHSALLVTDAFHSRRADLLFRAAFARKGLTVRSTPAPDALDLAHWWSHPLTARRVLEEWTKLAYYLIQGAYW
jgi:uncharacterized SAM-binding protein YcdF (DUF218 family)